MTTAIANLREVARRCLAREPLDAELSHWLGTAFGKFLGRESRSLDDALGVRFPQGGVPWWMEEAIRARDAALREMAERFYPRLSVSGQARAIFRASIRYGASAWRFDRGRDEMPAGYAGRPHACLWRAFKAGAAMPIGERQLRNILAR